MQIGTIFQSATLLGLPDFHQQANKLITFLGITQDKPNQVKRAFHRAKVTAQWSRMWSIDSPFLLHKQHLSTIITCLFQRLSTIRILPRVRKKNRSWRSLSLPYTLPWEATTFRTSQGAKGLDLEHASFGRDPPNLIFTTSTHYDWVQHLEEVKVSTSQSCASLTKLTFHCVESSKSSILSATKASFARAIPNRAGKASFRTVSPHHRSCQNFALALSPHLKYIKTRECLPPFHNVLPQPHPKGTYKL
jgi:hypothetical protein